MPDFKDWKKYDQELHVTWSYYPYAITYLAHFLNDKALKIINNTTLSQIINLGLLKQRNISYCKLTNEYQLTKKMIYNYTIWKDELIAQPKRTTLIISKENQKMFKLIKKQTKLTQATILNEIIFLGIIEKLKKENLNLDLNQVLSILSRKNKDMEKNEKEEK